MGPNNETNFKVPTLPDPHLAPYKSLGSVFGGNKESPPRENKKKSVMSNVGSPGMKTSRSSQNMAERSYSVSENSRGGGVQVSVGNVSRTPHRTAGYGGAGQPSRGPHRFGHPDMRASYSERLSTRQRTNYRGPPTPGQQRGWI